MLGGFVIDGGIVEVVSLPAAATPGAARVTMLRMIAARVTVLMGFPLVRLPDAVLR